MIAPHAAILYCFTHDLYSAADFVEALSFTMATIVLSKRLHDQTFLDQRFATTVAVESIVPLSLGHYRRTSSPTINEQSPTQKFERALKAKQSLQWSFTGFVSLCKNID